MVRREMKMPTRYTWRDLPAGGTIEFVPQKDGDVQILVIDQDGNEAKPYMGFQQAVIVGNKLKEAGWCAKLRATISRSRT